MPVYIKLADIVESFGNSKRALTNKHHIKSFREHAAACLDGYIGSDQEEKGHAVHRLLSLPSNVLRVIDGTQRQRDNFDKAQLSDDFVTIPVIPAEQLPKPSKKSDCPVNIRAVNELCNLGYDLKAVRMLLQDMSENVDVPTDARIAKLKSMYPQIADAPEPLAKPGDPCCITSLTLKEVRKIIKKMDTGASPGFSGWTEGLSQDR